MFSGKGLIHFPFQQHTSGPDADMTFSHQIFMNTHQARHCTWNSMANGMDETPSLREWAGSWIVPMGEGQLHSVWEDPNEGKQKSLGHMVGASEGQKRCLGRGDNQPQQKVK